MAQEESQVFRSGSHEEAGVNEGHSKKRKRKEGGPTTDPRHLHDSHGPSDLREMHDADSVEDLLAWAGVDGPVKPRDMHDAEGPSDKRVMNDASGPSNSRDMQDGSGPSDQRSLQDHYVTIDNKPVERKTIELGKRVDPSMAEVAPAAAPAVEEPLFTLPDAAPWALSLKLEVRIKDVGSKTTQIHNQIDRLEAIALNLGKRLKL